MASIVTKKIKSREYLYLVASVRKGKKVTQKTIKYIGKKRHISPHEFACMERSSKGEDWILKDLGEELSYQEHYQMKKASEAYRAYLFTLDPLSKQKEKERFLTLFIAESNAIEGSTLTKEETFNYLFNDITPAGKSKKELFMASNLFQAWKYVEEHAREFPTKKHLCLLHRIVNAKIETDSTLGNYKPVQNYIGDIYTTSYLFVEERVKQLLSWIKKAWKELDDFEVAFQSHAQFEIIHPFVDGNGRVGRLLLNWLLLYKNLMPLAIPAAKRADYLTALNNARKGNLEAISRFCFERYMEQYGER